MMMDSENGIDINFETILPESDVIIKCSDGVVPMHRLVLAHFSEMFLSIFEEDTKNEPSVVLMMDFTSKSICKYFEELLKSGFLYGKDLALEIALAIKKEFTEDFKSENCNGKPEDEDLIDVQALKNDDLEEVPNLIIEELQEVPKLKKEYLNIKSDVEDPLLLKPMLKSRKNIKEKSIKIKPSKNIEERRKMKNSTWYYFQKVEDNSKHLQCKLCAYAHKCPPAPKHKCTGPLNDHMRDKHTDVFLTLEIRKGNHKNIERSSSSKLSQYYTDDPDDLSNRFRICTICNSKIFRNNILRHIQSIHKKYDEKDAKPQMCSFCGKEFLHTWERDRHVSNVHQAKLRRKKVEQGFQGA